jgi:hypothetical protein
MTSHHAQRYFSGMLKAVLAYVFTKKKHWQPHFLHKKYCMNPKNQEKNPFSSIETTEWIENVLQIMDTHKIV